MRIQNEDFTGNEDKMRIQNEDFTGNEDDMKIKRGYKMRISLEMKIK